jgi:transcriptional regulator with XRE-family HTH domain
MTVNSGGTPATHFGRQMRKERTARGWSLREFSARTGINFGTASQIENGKRPPNENIAVRCDQVFPERHGWFLEYYEKSKSWMPAGFRSWGEYEDKAVQLRAWMPGIVHGLLQTADYARELIAVEPSITDEIIRARLAARMERQKRVLMREVSPQARFVIDEMSLYRRVGPPEAMATQLGHLAEVAGLPLVTVTVMPAVAHPANASEFIIADNRATYAEHITGSYVFTDDQTVSALAARFDTLRGECYRVSESMALIREMQELWSTGVNPLTRVATAAAASRSARTT